MNSPLADGSSSRLEISVQKTNGRRRNLAIVVLLDTNAAAAIKITFGAAARWVYLHKSSFGIQLVTRSRKRYSGSKKKCSLLSAARFNCLYTRRVINPFNLTFLQLGNNKQTESPSVVVVVVCLNSGPAPPPPLFQTLKHPAGAAGFNSVDDTTCQCFRHSATPSSSDGLRPPCTRQRSRTTFLFFFRFLKSCPSSV